MKFWPSRHVEPLRRAPRAPPPPPLPTKIFPHLGALMVTGEWRLIDSQTHETLYVGQVREYVRNGAPLVVEWAAPPTERIPLGKVHVTWNAGKGHMSSVEPDEIGALWVTGDELP